MFGILCMMTLEEPNSLLNQIEVYALGLHYGGKDNPQLLKIKREILDYKKGENNGLSKKQKRVVLKVP